jgi:hypothetical protein
MSTTPLRELLAQFGFQFDQAAAAQATQSIAGVIGSVRSLGQTLLAGAVVQGIGSFINGMIETGSELADTSAQMGISATELTEWRFAARLAGVDAGQLNQALGRTALAAQHGSPVLRRLGVQTRDAGGELRRASDIFEDAGVAIGALSNETERSAFATQLFGQSGRQLIPLFRSGRNGVRELRAEVRRLYGTDLDRLAEQADAAGDAQDRLNMVFDALQTRLSLYLLPTLTAALETMVDWGGSIAETARSSSILQAGLAVLGAIAVGAAVATIGVWGPPLLLFGLLAAAVGFVVLVVEDLITMFRGGRSVIGSFLDELFGVGTAAEVVRTLTEAWEGLKLAVTDAGDAVARFFGADSGEERATTRGFDARTAVSAERDQSRTALRTALSDGQQITPADAVRLFGRGSVSAPRAPSISTRRDVHVGAIHVSGAGDPLATAREVRRQIHEAGADDTDQTAADLAPATGGG